MSIDRDSLTRERTEVFTRNNAQEIFKDLQKLEKYRGRYRARWLWELIQNARDAHRPDRRMNIEVAVSHTEIRFRHDGRPFTRKEILSLIYHGSTKAESAEPLLGKFGTGFLSTHLLSPTVQVAGTLDQSDRSPVGFRFVLDRSGETSTAIEEAMERSYEDFMASGDSGTIAASDWTEYTYHLHGSYDTTLLDGLEDQIGSIPYVLVFDANIGCINITRPSGGRRFSLIGEDASAGGLQLVTVEVSQDGHETLSVRFAVARRYDVAVALKVASDNEAFNLQPLGDTPRLFKFLPLLGTTNIGLPAVFHSAAFRPTEERDGLYLAPGCGPETETNKQLLTACVQLLGEFAQTCSAAGWGNLYELLRVHPPDDGAVPWVEDVAWYRDLQQQLLEVLATVPLICNGTGQLIPPTEAVIPINDAPLAPGVLLRFSAPVYGEALPEAALASHLARIVEGWKAILGTNHALIQACVLNVRRLLAIIRESGNLSALASRVGGASTEALEWMNELIAAFPENERRTSFDGLLPDQTGEFRPHAELSRDDGIDDVLKDALKSLGEPLRQSLLHRDVHLMDGTIPRVETEENIVLRVKGGLKKQADLPDASADAAFRATCLSVFKWFADRDRWKDLEDSLPVFTLDREGSEVIKRTGPGSPKLLAPRTIWPEPARPFWGAFPPRTILADDYGSLLPSEIWSSVAAAGVVIKDLV